tara:strand:+ start:645 stop:890 length:246 start_codon:yes stop_codon:yes gene_type:complete
MENQISISEEIRDNKKVFVIENANINQEELKEAIIDYLEEPEVKPEIVEKIKKIEKEGNFREFSSIEEFDKHMNEKEDVQV